MRSFVTLLTFAVAATAATSHLNTREDAQTCAMKTLLSSSACNTGDAACLCSESARNSVMQEIKAACGAEQSDLTGSIATEACRVQKVRRATMPSATVVHMGLATPSSSAAASASGVNGAQDGSDEQACSCANTGSSKTNNPSVATEDATEDPEDLETSSSPSSTPSSHGSSTPSGSTTEDRDASAQSSSAHAASMMATPSSSMARNGAMTTPSASSSSRVATPSGADAFSPFEGAGAQIIPSVTVVAAGVFAGIVGVFAAL